MPVFSCSLVGMSRGRARGEEEAGESGEEEEEGEEGEEAKEREGGIEEPKSFWFKTVSVLERKRRNSFNCCGYGWVGKKEIRIIHFCIKNKKRKEKKRKEKKRKEKKRKEINKIK